MTPESWLEAHAYLRPIAELSAAVDRAAAAIDHVPVRIPRWEDYEADYRAGVTLLHSADAALDLEPGGRMAVGSIERLAADATLSLAAETRALNAELRRAPDAWRRMVDLLLGDESAVADLHGVARYLGWTAMKRFLRPVVLAFNDWRDEEQWGRRYCPTCGSLPAMAQLASEEHGRQRLLWCGCCGTRWHFKRTCCPFCENDAQRLESIVLEGESGLRIDHCASCQGYIKTYDGRGNESLLLSDWSSLHLDVLARDRGLKREASSLFDLEPAARN